MKETLLYLRMRVEEVTTHFASEPVLGPLLHYPHNPVLVRLTVERRPDGPRAVLNE